MIKIDKKLFLKELREQEARAFKICKILKTESKYQNANFEIKTKIELKQGLPHPEITITCLPIIKVQNDSSEEAGEYYKDLTIENLEEMIDE